MGCITLRRVRTGWFFDDPPQKIQERAPVVGLVAPNTANRLLDAAQDHGGVPFEGGARAAAGVQQQGFQFRDHSLGGQRGRTMIVDEATRRGFERCRERRHPLGDVIVYQRVKLGRLIADEKRADQEEEPRLPLAEVAHQMDERRDVALLLADTRRGRMLACAGEPGTLGRAVDFDETLGAAADRTDLFAEGGTSAPSAPISAQGADHSVHYCIIGPKSPSTHRNALCSPSVRLSGGAALYE